MIAMVRTAPRRMVSSTSASDSRIFLESSRTRVSLMSEGRVRRSSSTTVLTPSATSTVLEPVTFRTSRETAGMLRLLPLASMPLM